jgi:hypothetical protein
MLTKISWNAVRASEEAMKRLPSKYIKEDFFGRKEAYFEHCMDTEVIALAKEMKHNFLSDDNYEGFRIIAWDETKVVPMFFEGEYGDENLVFVSRESVKSDKDFETFFVGNNSDDCFDYDMMDYFLEGYEVVDYKETKVMVVLVSDE